MSIKQLVKEIKFYTLKQTKVFLGTTQESWYSFIEEIQHLSIKEILEKIKNNKNAQQMDSQGYYLFNTIIQENPKIIKYLLDIGFKADYVDKRKSTALLYAASYGNLECVNLLIQHGANIHQVDSFGKNLLYYLALSKEISIQPYLDLGLDINQKVKTDEGHETTTLINLCDIKKMDEASQNNYVLKNVQHFINYGADINMQENGGKTCLHVAIENQYLEFFYLLLRNKPNIELQDNKKDTAKTLIEKQIEQANHSLNSSPNNPNAIKNIFEKKKAILETMQKNLLEYEQNLLLHQQAEPVKNRTLKML